MVMMDTATSSHLMLKVMGHFMVGFPFSFILRMPGLVLKKQKISPLGFPTPPEIASPSFKIPFLLLL